jgi:bifunctional UDP-N-acetylglucosamine pyrophosphorylase/glucosamine-1-phosphate N-acetyltransferase
MVLAGDVPLLDPAVLKGLADEQVSSGMAATMLTTVLPEGGGLYGRVIRGADDTVEKIVEAKDATPSELAVNEINAAIYCFDLPLLRKYIDKLTPANAQGEYYLTDVIGLMVADGHKVGAVVSDDPNIVLGVNNRVDLAYLAGVVRQRILERLMLSGVTIIDPATTYADDDVVVGMDTVIQPMTVLEKGCKIGQNCTIGPSSRISGATVEDGATVLFSNIVDSTVGEGCKIGPFAHIRPGCTLGKGVKLGNFVEAKNAELEDAVSVGHLSYIGDAKIGEHTNIGAGTITCNYDGYKKHHTEIGRNVFVGSHNTMVAPVKVGDGSLTAAGSVITRDVPADALAISRSEEVIKIGWAKRRREQKDSE